MTPDESKLRGEALQAREKLIASFSGKMCPILTIGAFSPKNAAPKTTLVMGHDATMPPQQQEGEAMGCQGPACMWFVSTAADAHGNITSGACAAAVLPSSILKVSDTLAAGMKEATHE